MSARNRIGLALLALALTLLLGEAAMRIFVLPNPRLTWRPLPPFGRLVTQQQQDWLERCEREIAESSLPSGYGRFDPDLGWTHLASAASPDGRIHTNARGLRSTHEYPDTPAPGARRIALGGESFTFGEEVSDAEAWPALLEDLIPGLEAWNYGVGGYGTDQALLRMTREATGPVDALIVGLMIENIGRNVNRYRPLWYSEALPAVKPRYVLRGGALELLPQPFASRADFVAAVRRGTVLDAISDDEHWQESFVPGWLSWSAIARLLGSRRAYAARRLEGLWREVEGEPFRTTLAILDAFRPLARALGTQRLLVLVFPTRQAMVDSMAQGERYWSTLFPALEARGIVALDTSDALADAARSEGSVDPLFIKSHFSPLGNRIVAESVAEWLGWNGSESPR